MIVCKSPAELERMRAANALVADVLAELAAMVAPGVTTRDLDEAAERLVRDGGAEPAFKGYRGYPATLVRVGERAGRPRDPVGRARWSKGTSSRSTWA